MKNLGIKNLLVALFAFAVVFTGCSNSLDERSDSLIGESKFGSISINGNNGRAIFANDIVSAEASVAGTGIAPGTVPIAKTSITDGKGTLEISGIPVGKNRIVTVQAYNENGKIVGVTMRAICDVEFGKTTNISVNWSTTALGNIFAKLDSLDCDLNKLSSAEIEKINAAVPTGVKAPFVDAEAIASDYLSNSLKEPANYVLKPATVTVNVENLDGYKIYVGDPESSIVPGSSSSQAEISVSPGIWPIYAVDSTGNVKGFEYGTFKSGQNHVINAKNTDDKVSIVVDGTVIDDKIIVHAKDYVSIYIWNSGISSLDKTLNPMTQEENNWYSFTIPAVSANIIFTKAVGSWSGQTGDLSREAGEWWYKDGKWYSGNPEDSVNPVLESFTSDKTGTVSGTVKLTAVASDNASLKEIVFYAGEKNIGSVKADGTSANVSFEWDTSFIKNGEYTLKAIAYDVANNPSEEKTITITTSNVNLPPVAVISGSSFAKVDTEKEFSAAASYDQNGGTIKSYEWEVSEGASIKSGDGTEKITVTMPSRECDVTISLTVTDDGDAISKTVSKTVTVKEQAVSSGDFRDETIYFLMTTRFYDGDPSNNEYCWDEGGEYLKFGANDCAWRGDFKGLAEKLDYIKALGFSAIWITPVVENASGIDYHGYHAYDFSKVDPRYESTGFTYQDLIDACHAKGIKVIQDIVLNHTGNFGERNLFHMFDKETTPYVNKDIAIPVSGAATKRSPFMKLATDGSYGATALSQALGGKDYDTSIGAVQYGARINAMKEDSNDTDFIYHHCKSLSWSGEECQLGQIAGDCVDLNTENPVVAKYLRDCYVNYINMGVDGFRIDTVKHISRLTFNNEFIPQFMEAGGEDFYIFGETCARYRGRWNEGAPALSPSFYTWKEDKDFSWSSTDHRVNSESASKHFGTYGGNFDHPAWADGIANHLLKGNDYHTPDWSMRSHLDQIDFPMHWAFSNAPDAFNTAVQTNDPDFNDATWNVVYVDSHDYAPDNAPESQRYAKTEEWPRNMNLMFTFRGIPCIYYGSEIEFMAGAPIDPANTGTSLDKSGRAYFGDYITGSVEASGFGEYTASGTVQDTLNHPLAQHVIRLNKIRRAISALRKGQYSTEGCEGGISFKRRYTDKTVDSFVLVAIGAQATFKNVPSGEYIEVITGETVSCDGTLTSDEIGKDNMRVYVLKTATCEVDGKIGIDGVYLN